MNKTVDRTLEFCQSILKAQPFSQHIGAEIVKVGLGFCEVHLDLKPHHLQHQGIVHGGVTATLADISLAFAGGSVFQHAVTGDLQLNYVSPGKGSKLIAVAKVVHHKTRSAWCEAKIYNDAVEPDHIVMIATGTIKGSVPKSS